MNAYDLADRLEEFYSGTHITKAVETLRQQADRIAELEKELSWWRTNFKLPTEPNSPRPNWLYAPQTKPLSDEEIMEIKTLMEINYGCVPPLEFAWAIEERHGIK